MKKRLVSIILTAFLILSMMPFSAFADGIVCPACGGTVTKQERRLVSAHDDFYKCDTCGKWAWVNKLGSLSLFSVGDQQILDASDASALINFSFNNGHLIPAKQAPSGIGRKDLPGYADDSGTAAVDKEGYPTATYTMLLDGYDTSAGRDTVYEHLSSNEGSWFYRTNGSFSGSNGNVSAYGYYDESNNNFVCASVGYYLVAPVSGYYTINSSPVTFCGISKDSKGNYSSDSIETYYFFAILRLLAVFLL